MTSKTLIASAMLAALAATPAFAADDPNTGTEAKVRSAFPDVPAMVAVAKCESGYRQFAPDGSVLRGGPGGRYVGVFQIDEPLHADTAKLAGNDILTTDGNIAYAKALYALNGIGPWKGCAPAASAAPPAPAAAPGTLTADLRLGMRHPQVATLQSALRAAGFAVSANGPGSAGHETSYFGALTRAAVRKFQCAKKIACDGDEATTGYGRVGPRTREALNGATP